MTDHGIFERPCVIHEAFLKLRFVDIWFFVNEEGDLNGVAVRHASLWRASMEGRSEVDGSSSSRALMDSKKN